MRVRIVTDGVVFMPQRKKMFGWEPFVKHDFKILPKVYWEFETIALAQGWMAKTYGEQFKWEQQWVPAVVVKA